MKITINTDVYLIRTIKDKKYYKNITLYHIKNLEVTEMEFEYDLYCNKNETSYNGYNVNLKIYNLNSEGDWEWFDSTPNISKIKKVDKNVWDVWYEKYKKAVNLFNSVIFENDIK